MAKVFVAGATGKQGGAVASALLKDGIPVHALVRDLNSASAKALAAAGATLFKGDWDDLEALDKAVEGTTALFLVTMPSFTDPPAELRCAQNIVKAGVKAGVNQIVTTTTVGTGQYDRVPGWDKGHPFLRDFYWPAKRGAEVATKESGVKYWTILRPTDFMTNYVDPTASWQVSDLVKEGVWHTAFTPEYEIELIDVGDIGRVALRAFKNPEEWHGREVVLAGDKLTATGIVDVLKGATGKDLKVWYYPTREEAQKAALEHPVNQGQVHRVNAVGLEKKDNEIENVRPLVDFKLKTFKEYAEEIKDDLIATYKNVA